MLFLILRKLQLHIVWFDQYHRIDNATMNCRSNVPAYTIYNDAPHSLRTSHGRQRSQSEFSSLVCGPTTYISLPQHFKTSDSEM